MKVLFSFLIAFSITATIQAQKFGYVDTDYILTKVPEYKEAILEIDKLSIEHQKKIDLMFLQVDSMVNTFQLEEPLLTDDQKDKRQAAIDAKEKEIKKYQTDVFGYEGEIWLKRQDLITPIQNRIFTSITKVAKKHKLQMVFDKAGDLVILYANPVHDYTDYVLEDMGLGNPKDVLEVDKYNKQ
ncbi:OmpH family outer membrane protein [Cyclobacteriaceae bacterium]|nr:OmpH family outer membrane protein [Cyclobacteriaceae bacterium]